MKNEQGREEHGQPCRAAIGVCWIQLEKITLIFICGGQDWLAVRLLPGLAFFGLSRFN